jgi:hypothetical protein
MIGKHKYAILGETTSGTREAANNRVLLRWCYVTLP